MYNVELELKHLAVEKYINPLLPVIGGLTSHKPQSKYFIVHSDKSKTNLHHVRD